MAYSAAKLELGLILTSCYHFANKAENKKQNVPIPCYIGVRSSLLSFSVIGQLENIDLPDFGHLFPFDTRQKKVVLPFIGLEVPLKLV